MYKRPRRTRSRRNLRDLVRETNLNTSDFIYPVFVRPGSGLKEEIPSLPGCFHYSRDRLFEKLAELEEEGLKAVLIFGVPDVKDEQGSGAWAEDGIVQKTLRYLRDKGIGLELITDLCLCAYTTHGHCGVVENGRVANDATLELLKKVALSHARAGADMIAPSDMMDGRIRAIREVLDDQGFKELPIMSYSAKYASAFYGPFRDAAHSAPEFGDRSGYQMDPGNRREACREVMLDIEEGADIVMVKPALAYLDIIRDIKEMTSHPVAAYSVSGEYAMVRAAAREDLVDEDEVTMEMMLAIKRAGADMIITYSAPDLIRRF